jgi:hypothetical protein
MKKKEMLLLGLAIGAAAATAILIFLKRKNEDKPPRNAPQVPVNNPGEQSEFTTSASESEVG